MSDIFKIRRQYTGRPLRRSGLTENPLDQFALWMNEAIEAEVPEPIGMTLGTLSEGGYVNQRIVLLRSYSEEGFVFFTNYNSEKARELAENPMASLHFFWEPIHRQVKITGDVRMTLTELSDDYFNSRPREHQIGAWASEQSVIISTRKFLEERVEYYTQKFDGMDVPRPPHWGGYALMPVSVEFWQGRENRLHDRFRYELKDRQWLISRLSP